MSAPDEALLRVAGLKKHFPHDDSIFVRLNPTKEVKYVKAVDGVSFEIKRGETLGLVGESGCGKSTLARTVLRLIEPTEGEIHFGDDDVGAMSTEELRAFRKKAQMIYQDPFSSLNPRYTVRKTLVEPMRIHGIGASADDRDRLAAELLERVGLDPQYLQRHPHEFSGGQRQRISIARALAVEPELIVADEPTSALDVSVQANILNLLNDLKDDRDLTLLFISHDLSVVRYISDRIAVMYLGELVETGDTDAVFADPKHPYTESLLSSVPSQDPDARMEFVPLKGDVPTPIDPPSGCRFHTRCPKVIPPESWPADQAAWREYVSLKHEFSRGIHDAEALAATEGGETLLADRFGLDPDSEPGRTVLAALDALADGGPDSALAVLDRGYHSPCESVPPGDHRLDGDRTTECHLYDPTQPGSAEGVADPVSSVHE